MAIHFEMDATLNFVTGVVCYGAIEKLAFIVRVFFVFDCVNYSWDAIVSIEFTFIFRWNVDYYDSSVYLCVCVCGRAEGHVA